jgi:hypothetical protein
MEQEENHEKGSRRIDALEATFFWFGQTVSHPSINDATSAKPLQRFLR